MFGYVFIFSSHHSKLKKMSVRVSENENKIYVFPSDENRVVVVML